MSMNLGLIFTNGLGTVFNDEMFAMFPAHMAADTIMASQV